jgi:hypothetical protein
MGVLLCEILVRFVAPQNLIDRKQPIWCADETLGHRNTPSSNLMINTGEGYVHFITDQDGYRINFSNRHTYPVDSADITILMLGDSFLEALALENEQTIPEVLSKLLSEKHELRVRAVNAGVGGYTPSQYYLEVRRSLAIREYDLGVVFLYVGNDCVARIDTLFGSDVKSARDRFVRQKAPRKQNIKYLVTKNLNDIGKFLEERSHLFVLIKYQAYYYFPKFGFATRNFPKIFFKSSQGSRRWETVAEICSLIQFEFNSRNVPVIFVLLPPVYQSYETHFYDYMKFANIPRDSLDINLPNRMLAASFEKRSLHLVDPLDHMHQKVKDGFEMYGTVDRHLNAQGHLVLAEYLLPITETYLGLNDSERVLHEGDLDSSSLSEE